MSSAAQMSDEEVNQLMMELKEHVKQVKATAVKEDKKRAEQEARKHYKKVRSSVNAFSSEVRNIQEPVLKSQFQRKQQEYASQLKDLDKELKDAMRPPKKTKHVEINHEEELMGEGGVDGSGFTNANQVLAAGQRINNDALQSIARSERLVASAEETGQATMVELQKQGEVIKDIDDDMNTIKAQVKRAKADVSQLARQMAGDKCFIMIFLLMVLCLAGLVFYKMYKDRQDKKKAEEDANTPAPTLAPRGDTLGGNAEYYYVQTAGHYVAKRLLGRQ